MPQATRRPRDSGAWRISTSATISSVGYVTRAGSRATRRAAPVRGRARRPAGPNTATPSTTPCVTSRLPRSCGRWCLRKGRPRAQRAPRDVVAGVVLGVAGPGPAGRRVLPRTGAARRVARDPARVHVPDAADRRGCADPPRPAIPRPPRGLRRGHALASPQWCSAMRVGRSRPWASPWPSPLQCSTRTVSPRRGGARPPPGHPRAQRGCRHRCRGRVRRMDRGDRPPDLLGLRDGRCGVGRAACRRLHRASRPPAADRRKPPRGVSRRDHRDPSSRSSR